MYFPRTPFYATSCYLQEDCCDICGDIGVADALITCTQCKINSEHMYCMRTVLEELPDDWHCEECESSSKPRLLASCLLGELPGVSKINPLKVRKGGELRTESRKLPKESRVGSGDWEKMVATGKTKYICVKEAIMLSTGEKKSSAPSNFTCHSKAPPTKIGINKSERTAIRPPVPLNFSSQQDRASGPLRQPKPQRLGNMEICEGQLQQSNKLTVLRSESSLQPSQAPKNKHMQKEQPREVQLPRTKARSLVKKQSSAPSLNASPVTISGVNGDTTIELRTADAETINNNLLPNLEKCSFTPALDALWKGSFTIQDDHRHGELNHQIQAHPPSQVRRKVYEFSKQMPEVLHFQFVPARKFWISLFKDYTPDEKDIALYFFPSVGERLEAYICLLESISVANLALRKQIADVELLVFTSTLLPVNCQCWKGKYFLWGVFHRLKRDATASLDNRVLELSVQPSDDATHANNPVDDSEEFDMDIDMIGGINVGRMDIPVLREPLRGKYTSFGEKPAAAMSLPGSGQITSVSKHDLDLVTSVPSLNVKMEPHDLIPPGFEEVFKLRIEGSSSSVGNVGGREGTKERTG